jgi:hypothetical protein
MGVIEGRMEEADFDVAGVVAGVDPKEVLEDFIACDWLSEECPAKDEAVGDWRRDDDAESWAGDAVTPLSSLVGAIDPLEVGVVELWLFMDTFSMLSWSPLLDAGPGLSFPTPTAPRNRLYSPLRPFCMISPAKPLLSRFADEGGGEANSLKVVSVSEWLAVLCILSKAWANCSLSTGADPVIEARDPRRDRRPRGTTDGTLVEVLRESWEDILDIGCSAGWSIVKILEDQGVKMSLSRLNRPAQKSSRRRFRIEMELAAARTAGHRASCYRV